MSSTIIKDASAAYQPWQLPVVEDISAAVANAKDDKASGLLTAEKIEQIQAQAYQEAYEAGYSEGRVAGLASGQQEVNRNI